MFYAQNEWKMIIFGLKYRCFFAIYAIERTLPRCRPTIRRWEGYFMANTDKWYYAYTIEGDTITVVDVCHAQNMHE